MQIITSHNFRHPGKGFIATVGMFDGVHKGHRYLIELLRHLGEENDYEPLVVTFVNHPFTIVKSSSSPSLLSSVSERLRLIEKAGVNKCLLLEFTEELRKMSAFEFISFLKREFNVKGLLAGFNHRFGSDHDSSPFNLEESASRAGVNFYRGMEYSFNSSMKISSSHIRRLISKTDVEEASDLLGHPYELTGKVSEGRKIGRSIGFPTANLTPIVSEKIIPGNGVYATMARIDDENGLILPAMVNIGFNPTVSDQKISSIEAHLIGLPQGTNLYRHIITLYFYKFIRQEEKFESLEDLKKRLSLDRQTTIENLKTKILMP